MKRALRITIIACAALLVLGATLVLFALHTEGGSRSVLALARNWLPAGMTIGSVQGTVGGTLRVRNFHYRDESVGMDLRVDSADVEVANLALLWRRLHVIRAQLDGVRLELFAGSGSANATANPRDPWIAPLDMRVDELRITHGELRHPGAEPLSIRQAHLLGGRWIGASIVTRELAAEGPDGQFKLAVKIGEGAPKLEQLRGTFRWSVADNQWSGSVDASGGRDELHLRAALESPVKVGLAGTLALSHKNKILENWKARLSVDRFDPHPLLQTDAFRTAALELDGTGDDNSAALQGVLSLDDERVIIERLSVERRDRLLQIPEFRLRLNAQPAALSGRADLALDGSAPASAKFSWDEFHLPDAWMGRNFRCSGQMAATVSSRHFAVNGNIRLARDEKNSTLTMRLDGSPQAVHIQEFELTQMPGALSVSGNVELASPVRWQLAGNAREFDPSLFLADWPGALSFDLRTTGEWPEAGPRARFQLPRLAGRLRGRGISGSGDISIGSDRTPSGNLQLQSGGASLTALASTGAHPSLKATLKVAALQEWRKALSGAIDLQATATGRWPDIELEAHLAASKLSAGDLHFNTAKGQLTARNLRNVRSLRGVLDINASGLTLAGLSFDDLAMRLDGDATAHRFELAANGPALSLGLNATGALERDTWSGVVDKLGVTVQHIPPLALTAPTRVVVAGDDFELGHTCLAGGDISLCSGVRREHGELAANYSIKALPLQLLTDLAAPGASVSMEGLLEGSGDLHRAANGAVRGRAALASASGSLVQGTAKDGLRLEYRDLGIDLELTPTAAQARLRGVLPKQGDLSGSISMGMGETDPTVSGDASVKLRDLAPLGWWVPQLANLRGSGELTAQFSGTRSEPQVALTVRGTGLDAEVPVLGVHLRDGNVAATLEPAGVFRAEGSLGSGDGSVRLSGGRNAEQALELKIAGNDFLAANIPGARVVIAPELALAGKIGDLALTGSVKVEDADVNLEKLSISRSYRASSDVVIVDREQKIERHAPGLTTDVRVVLGDRVKITGFGLDAVVGGELQVVEGKEGASRATGEIRLAGTYEAFGRKLGIERGKLTYAGTALDDPQLDVLATRKLKDVTAKLTVTGTAQHPKLEVFADPAMSQTDAMSYLLTGKPASDVHGEDGAMVQLASQNVGMILGNRLAKKLGGKVGFVDQVGVEQNADLGGSAFTVGKYLSPKLFVSYGVGLFEPGSAVTVRYEFSERWSLEASDTPDDQHAGVRYRIEK